MDINNLKEGTKVRISQSVDCDEAFKEGGILVKGNKDVEEFFDEEDQLAWCQYPYGIKVVKENKVGVCYLFNEKDYELA